jgi:hypothetical protein
MTSLKRILPVPAVVVVVVGALVACSPGKPPSEAPAPGASTASPHPPVPHKISLSYDDARAVLDAHQADLPASLRDRDPAAQAAAWPGWVAAHDADIRARLAHGDEDSILNLWLYGTSFTTLPRATPRDLAAAKSNASKLLEGRLSDLIDAAASPGNNERLQFVRQVFVSRGIDPSTDAGQNEAWTYLAGIRDRVNRGRRSRSVTGPRPAPPSMPACPPCRRPQSFRMSACGRYRSRQDAGLAPASVRRGTPTVRLRLLRRPAQRRQSARVRPARTLMPPTPSRVGQPSLLKCGF